MLKRSCPRSRSFSVIWNGSSLTVAVPIFPVKNASSSCSVPRATVPSISGRALDLSANSVLGRSGRYFGWLCMSWRHPLTSASAATSIAVLLWLDFIDLLRPQVLQQRPGLHPVELRIVRLDGEEQAVLARL